MDNEKKYRGKKRPPKDMTAEQIYQIAEKIEQYADAIKGVSADVQRHGNVPMRVPTAPFYNAFKQLDAVTEKLQRKMKDKMRSFAKDDSLRDLLG